MLINPRHPDSRRSPNGSPLYTAGTAAAFDRQVIAEGTPGFELMQKAARSAWQLIQKRWPDAQRLSVFCGGGNNGGDGLLVALAAAQAGRQVRLWVAGNPQEYRQEAAQAWQAVQQAGLSIQVVEPKAQALAADDLLVDALLGIGLKGEVKGQLADWIEAINGSQVPVLALDTPSGLEVDQGRVVGQAVKARVTLTFILLKPGLFTGRGPDQAGEVWLSDLGLGSLLPPDPPVAWLQGVADQQDQLAPRQPGGHKGTHGRLLIIAGQAGMGGAAILAAQAALRSGVGMVKLLTAEENLTAALVSQPEILVAAWSKDPAARPAQLQEAFAWADALLIGPGLGQSPLAQQLWAASWTFSGPVLVDADALNLWAQGWEPPAAQQRPWVITPHPGEAASLLGQDISKVTEDRLAAVKSLVAKTGSVSLLKGAGSCCASPSTLESPVICPFGNPGMGVAGMGDLLSGCIAAFLAQGLAAEAAARLGMRVHAQAGDRAAGQEPRGLVPSDLLPYLREAVN